MSWDETISSIIPVVLIGGLAYKMTDSMFNKQQQQRQQPEEYPKRQRRRNVYDREYNGRFRNVGF